MQGPVTFLVDYKIAINDQNRHPVIMLIIEKEIELQPCKQNWRGTLDSPCLSCLSMSCNSPLTNEPILMKLSTSTVYDLRMCMKENNSCANFFTGDT